MTRLKCMLGRVRAAVTPGRSLRPTLRGSYARSSFTEFCEVGEVGVSVRLATGMGMTPAAGRESIDTSSLGKAPTHHTHLSSCATGLQKC